MIINQNVCFHVLRITAYVDQLKFCLELSSFKTDGVVDPVDVVVVSICVVVDVPVWVWAWNGVVFCEASDAILPRVGVAVKMGFPGLCEN